MGERERERERETETETETERERETMSGDGVAVVAGCSGMNPLRFLGCLERYGESDIILSSANTHSYKKLRRTLAEYMLEFLSPRTLEDVAGDTFYHFGDNNVMCVGGCVGGCVG